MKVESVHVHEYNYNKFLVKLEPNWFERNILGREEKEIIVKKMNNGYRRHDGEPMSRSLSNEVDKAFKRKNF